MNHFCNFVLLFFGSCYLLCVQGIARLTSVSISVHARELHRKLGNENAPHSVDVATSDAHIRQRICEDILSNSYLYALNLLPVDITEIYEYFNRNHLKYVDIFHRIYSRTLEQDSYEYTNKYKQQQLQLLEYVFVCPVTHSTNNHINFFYISKEYNVGSEIEHYKPGRFVFGNFMPLHQSLYGSDYVMLAEEPTKIFTEPEFNVEVYYLNLRNYVESATSWEVDPLCKLINTNNQSEKNQYNRICMAVCTSSYFRYAHQAYFPCSLENVSFRSDKNRVGELLGKSYNERMTTCYCNHIHISVRSNELYISRAYKSNEIFVYRRDPSNEEIYLENLSTNVSIVDEINSFDFVEK